MIRLNQVIRRFTETTILQAKPAWKQNPLWPKSSNSRHNVEDEGVLRYGTWAGDWWFSGCTHLWKDMARNGQQTHLNRQWMTTMCWAILKSRPAFLAYSQARGDQTYLCNHCHSATSALIQGQQRCSQANVCVDLNLLSYKSRRQDSHFLKME